MQFLSKTVNQFINRESIDVSIPEMLELIQAEILDKVSSSELKELEKGMHKTWVLGVGGGSSLRYYPSSGSAVKLCLDFNMITHQLQQISLHDTVNRKEYFIPRGKESATKLQRAVLYRISKSSGVSEASSQEPGNTDKAPNSGDPLIIKKWSGLGVLALVVLLGILNFPQITGVFFDFPSSHSSEWISTVKNGYLGEYTDMTVYELLGNYRIYYENEIWDGGTTDSGSMIVEVQFYDEGEEGNQTVIQFTMLDEECFKITAFVDPTNPVKKSSDLLAAMNYNYLLAYVGANREIVGDAEEEAALITRLGQISGSAVQYGASANYSGNRATICEMDGKIPLDVSVAMLLDNYGLVDLSAYITNGTEDNLGEDPTAETEPIEPSVESNTTPSVEVSADTLLLAVLKGEANFVMSDTNEVVTIDGVRNVAGDEFDFPLLPHRYAYADMDQDGQRELIVELTNNFDGWRVVLRYLDGTIYGYGYRFRGLQSISANGIGMGSSGAAYTDVFRLRFDSSGASEEYLSSFESEYELENWVEVEWFDYYDETAIKNYSLGQYEGTFYSPSGFYFVTINPETDDIFYLELQYNDGLYESGYAEFGEEEILDGGSSITIVPLGGGDIQVKLYPSIHADGYFDEVLKKDLSN